MKCYITICRVEPRYDVLTCRVYSVCTRPEEHWLIISLSNSCGTISFMRQGLTDHTIYPDPAGFWLYASPPILNLEIPPLFVSSIPYLCLGR